MNDLLIGSHVSLSGDDMLLNATKDAIRYGENTFMVYTGAPQNTRRKQIDKFKIKEAHSLMLENNIDIKNIIVHAPYIINLGNSIKQHVFDLGVDFLKKEIQRAQAIGAKHIVLHPGSHVGCGINVGLNSIIKGLNLVIDKNQNIKISLEIMSGKGSECGSKFEELKFIIDNVYYKDKISICLDTCHMWDSGYNIVDNYESVFEEFDKIIGIDKIGVLHINDSKNLCGSHKDRHENIGFGKIGFKTLHKIVHENSFKNIPKILETPFIDKIYPPYKEEIKMLKKGEFSSNIREVICNN